MKKIIVTFTMLFCLISSLADDNFILVIHEDPLWIYPSAYSTKPKRVIQNIGELNVYAFKVLEDSLYRFKVRIYEPDAQDDIHSDIGWIDKINATVFLGIHEYEYNKMYLRLYERPDKDSHFKAIAENDHETMVGYVDKIYQNWYHVNVIYKGNMYSGWTDYYCVNPYGCN